MMALVIKKLAMLVIFLLFLTFAVLGLGTAYAMVFVYEKKFQESGQELAVNIEEIYDKRVRTRDGSETRYYVRFFYIHPITKQKKFKRKAFESSSFYWDVKSGKKPLSVEYAIVPIPEFVRSSAEFFGFEKPPEQEFTLRLKDDKLMGFINVSYAIAALALVIGGVGILMVGAFILAFFQSFKIASKNREEELFE